MKTYLYLAAAVLWGLPSLPAQTGATIPDTRAQEVQNAPTGTNVDGLAPTYNAVGYVSVNGSVYAVLSNGLATPLANSATIGNIVLSPNGASGPNGGIQNIPNGTLLSTNGQLMMAPVGLYTGSGTSLNLPAYSEEHGASNFLGGMEIVSTPSNLISNGSVAAQSGATTNHGTANVNNGTTTNGTANVTNGVNGVTGTNNAQPSNANPSVPTTNTNGTQNPTTTTTPNVNGTTTTTSPSGAQTTTGGSTKSTTGNAGGGTSSGGTSAGGGARK